MRGFDRGDAPKKNAWKRFAARKLHPRSAGRKGGSVFEYERKGMDFKEVFGEDKGRRGTMRRKALSRITRFEFVRVTTHRTDGA